jgi:hypothetical protein
MTLHVFPDIVQLLKAVNTTAPVPKAKFMNEADPTVPVLVPSAGLGTVFPLTRHIHAVTPPEGSTSSAMELSQQGSSQMRRTGPVAQAVTVIALDTVAAVGFVDMFTVNVTELVQQEMQALLTA